MPVRLSYIKQKMIEGEQLDPTNELMPKDVDQHLRAKFLSIEWARAKSDVARFLRDPGELDAWSSDFFLSTLSHLKWE